MSTETAPQPQPAIEEILSKEIQVKPHQVWAAIKLLDGGATVPFIARYRKEATGGMSDTHLRLLADRLEYLRELESRRIAILQSIEEQGKLVPELKDKILAVTSKSELEDLYLPFRPRKRTKAQAAREMGLEPLADLLLSGQEPSPETITETYVRPEKGVSSVAEALGGAREILIERFAEDAALIGGLRRKYTEEGWIHSRLIEGKGEAGIKFSDYFDHKEPIKGIPSHRTLALLRGRQEEFLRVSLEPGSPESDETYTETTYVQRVAERFGIVRERSGAGPWLWETARLAWRLKLRIHLELDILMELRKRSEEEAIRVFAENLKNLLLASPAGGRPTLGLDPGFRTGVKIAAVDATGKLIATATVYPHPPQEEWRQAVQVIATMIQRYKIELVAVGNGTASRETEKLALEAIKLTGDAKVQKVVVSEAGASVYSASELASNELPRIDVSLRGAVSIARRLQDPLAELVKIDPKSIGVGQYQHDVNQTRLAQALHNVVEDCVNAVGVDVNTASPSLLSYVSGLNKRTAASLVAHRHDKGAFKDRQELLKIADFGSKTFEQAAGFLRIRGGDNPLDASAVHPESYPVVERILSKTQKPISELIGNSTALKKLDAKEFTDERFGLPTVQDILAELEKPGRDPRPEFRTATFKEDINKLEDLKPGMVLEGCVTNVANFGAFVDIGVHQDGLVHISELTDGFVDDPHKIIKTGQIVKVRVVEVDLARRRVALTLRSGPAKPKGRDSGPSRPSSAPKTGGFNTLRI
ncbi:MAG: Protein YhgF [Candidatus Omnitrophica bacterium]|nr:Protein YhgF [Candidatus Omnitrophota bacterium]